jgi:hypothetical protein
MSASISGIVVYQRDTPLPNDFAKVKKIKEVSSSPRIDTMRFQNYKKDINPILYTL